MNINRAIAVSLLALTLVLYFIYAPLAVILLGGMLLFLGISPLFWGGGSGCREESGPGDGGVVQQEARLKSEGGHTPSPAALGGAYQQQEWMRFEEDVARHIDSFLIFVEERFRPQTAAVFLPRAEGRFVVASYISSARTFCPSARIESGHGLLGSYIKDGVFETCLHELRSTQQIDYYEKPGGARSLLMAPVKAVNTSGVIVVDSTDAAAFEKQDLDWLVIFGSLMGQSLYYAYLYKMNTLLHEEVRVINDWSQRCMRCKDLSTLLHDLSQILTTIFGYDRLSISIRDTETRVARVVLAQGDTAADFDSLEYSVEPNTIASLFFGEDMDVSSMDVLCRPFSGDAYEVRYSSREGRHSGFSFFAALPLGLETTRGLVLLEKKEGPLFGKKDLATMTQLIGAASLAVEKILLLRQQENLAIRDGLTGLYNHRHFERLLHEAIVRSHRLTSPLGSGSSSVEKVPVALVICDIDHFKSVNDTYGHTFGDTVLVSVAHALEQGIREGVDFAARYGGEEFALILYGSTLSDAMETTERIRMKIASLEFKTLSQETVSVTMSFGLAMYDTDAQQQEVLIRMADKALYRAKDGGRNRVECVSGREEDR
ncbi:sensor domain-containing diguanylate cyclase [Chitinivibrio alkaliphilus]|uniref:diguanylate cyclase n=1 Tax=Chitinivibrio alkaliphilus ACht1 TaxID=1313304 RepID=U7D9Y2_9BACT|nr:GGDEF domain-containing protein [Chitinivibrio alkaliphilus]ERP31902.1 diguanylate cyclase [Chitinivibrio alkaliphilus ACht1]